MMCMIPLRDFGNDAAKARVVKVLTGLNTRVYRSIRSNNCRRCIVTTRFNRQNRFKLHLFLFP